MKENVPPEERLLKLIRGERKVDLKPQAITPRIYFLAQKYLISTFIHKAIYLLIVTSFIYLFASLIYPFVGLKKIKLPTVSLEKAKVSVVSSKEKVKPYEFYLAGIRRRQIFITPTEQSLPKSPVAGEAESIKDINLVGIISGENSQAIIEDKKNQKVYYVSKGQSIGAIQVEDIQEGKIILNYKEKKYELYM